MDERDNNISEFSLEDILKEFGTQENTDESVETEKLEESEDVRLWGEENENADSPEEPLPQDTVRLDEITRAVKKQTVSDATISFTPVGDQPEQPAEQPAAPAAEEPEVEPYSDSWEPEYEQPIGNYIPPEPIIFRPKSRLWELKKKLVAGPEKRFYDLAEQGLGKLQMAIICNLAVALISAVLTGLYAMDVIHDNRLRFLVFGQFLSLLLSALLGSYQLMEGVTDLFKGKFSLNTLLVFSLIACLADGLLCLKQVRVPCCAAFSFNMTMSLWSTYQKRNIEMGQMDTMRKAINLDSVVASKDFYEGRPGFLRGEGQVEDFMDNYQQTSAAERTMNIYALTALLVSLAIGVAAGFLHSVATGIQFFSASLLVSVPATSYITLSRPMAILERKLHQLGTVICGWRGVKGMSVPAVFPLKSEDLFPAGSVKMNGVKFYGTRNPDEVVAYATAVISADGGGMAPIFTQLLESRSGYHYEVENLRSYGNGGIGGIVEGEAVLAGTLSFMQEMGVEMPNGTHVNQAVYVAIDGALCGVFAMTYNKIKTVAAGLTTLCAYRGLTPVLTSGDFILTEGFIRKKFGVNTRQIAFPDRNVRQELASREPDEGAEVLALTTREGLASAAYAVTGARALKSASYAGVTVHMLGGILGLVIMAALTVLGSSELLTPVNMLLYELIWMIPGLLITEWTRLI